MEQELTTVTVEHAPMTTYEIWEHLHLYEWAVRIEDGQVTGACSISLDFACDPDGRLPELEYDTTPAALK